MERKEMGGEGGCQSRYLQPILMGAGRKVGNRPAKRPVWGGRQGEEPWERTPLSTSRRGAGQHLQAAWDFQGDQRS